MEQWEGKIWTVTENDKSKQSRKHFLHSSNTLKRKKKIKKIKITFFRLYKSWLEFPRLPDLNRNTNQDKQDGVEDTVKREAGPKTRLRRKKRLMEKEGGLVLVPQMETLELLKRVLGNLGDAVPLLCPNEASLYSWKKKKKSIALTNSNITRNILVVKQRGVKTSSPSISVWSLVW